jgi:AraC family transcriptional regulator
VTVTRAIELGPVRRRAPRRGAVVRAATVASRLAAVERAAGTMRARFREPLTLDDLAHEAYLSPYHFNRVFRAATGVPPGRFLAALRMEAARRLLLTTSLRVTDICLEVGYRSLGTFTTHFRELVGIAPSRTRRLAALHGDMPVASLESPDLGTAAEAAPAGHALRVSAPDGFDGTAFIGLFPSPLPQASPLGCAVVSLPAETRLYGSGAGVSYALACAFARGLTIGEALVAAGDQTRVGVSRVVAGREPVELLLRPLGALDPPILLAGPLVLADALAESAAA